MKIEYKERDGTIHFSATEGSERGVLLEVKGVVPKRIEEQGQQAVEAYARRSASTSIRRQKQRRKKIDAFCDNPDFPVSVRFDGRLLKGKIFLVADHCLHVRLERPYKGETGIRFGWASAMAGHRILNVDGTSFTNHAIETAERLLIQIYEKEKHRRTHRLTIELVDELNDGGT